MNETGATHKTRAPRAGSRRTSSLVHTNRIAPRRQRSQRHSGNGDVVRNHRAASRSAARCQPPMPPVPAAQSRWSSRNICRFPSSVVMKRQISRLTNEKKRASVVTAIHVHPVRLQVPERPAGSAFQPVDDERGNRKTPKISRPNSRLGFVATARIRAAR